MRDNYLPISNAGLDYALYQLLDRAGFDGYQDLQSLSRVLGVRIHYGIYEDSDSATPRLVIRQCSEQSWHDILNLRDSSLIWFPVEDTIPPGLNYPFDSSVPVLFWGDGIEGDSSSFFEENKNRSVIINADIISATLFMLTRWEEIVVPVRDEHNRFPGKESVAFKQGFLDIPIVDQYALILQAWIKKLVQSWEPKNKKFSISLSHDIDSIKAPLFRKMGGDIFKRRNISMAVDKLKYITKQKSDPYLEGIFELADSSERQNLKSAFYWMTADQSDMDSGYFAQFKDFKTIVKELQSRGHEAGFHAGYYTYDDRDRFKIEKNRLERATGLDNFGGRQHYLRFKVPNTWRLWEQVELAYDSTMGYSDNEGFRCGTCFPFHPFDLEYDRQMNIVEIPLIVMEATLIDKQGFSSERFLERVLLLAKRCKEVNGVFTLLWHNTRIFWEWTPWWITYKQLLFELNLLREK